jgi:hypothetical protein
MINKTEKLLAISAYRILIKIIALVYTKPNLSTIIFENIITAFITKSPVKRTSSINIDFIGASNENKEKVLKKAIIIAISKTKQAAILKLLLDNLF